MLVFDKQEIRDSLTTENIFELLQDWGGDPEFTDFGIISATICHNEPGEGSRKLYFYSNTTLFHCYTGCDEPNFDIFQLTIKVMKIQEDMEFDLNDAVRWIAVRFGISGREEAGEDEELLDDWKFFANYSRIQDIQLKDNNVILKEYDPIILDRFNYDLRLEPWLNEGISQEVLDHARIGFYPGMAQITIPHYDKDGRFIGLRGRTVVQEDAERFGKYRPMKVNKQLYNHPLGMNLYNYNFSKDNIAQIKKAIVFEGEKSCLLYQSYFGIDNDISVACCGSSLSAYQVSLLLAAGAKEIVIAFDRQFRELGDDEFKHLTNNLTKINNKYKNEVLVSIIFDKKMITNYKDSPIDKGKDTFLKLFKERIIL